MISYLDIAKQKLAIELNKGLGAKERTVEYMMKEYELSIEVASFYTDVAYDWFLEAYS